MHVYVTVCVDYNNRVLISRELVPSSVYNSLYEAQNAYIISQCGLSENCSLTKAYL